MRGGLAGDQNLYTKYLGCRISENSEPPRCAEEEPVEAKGKRLLRWSPRKFLYRECLGFFSPLSHSPPARYISPRVPRLNALSVEGRTRYRRLLPFTRLPRRIVYRSGNKDRFLGSGVSLLSYRHNVRNMQMKVQARRV